MSGCTAEGRKHLNAGTWLITTLLALLALSYYGEFGPLDAPALPEPYDLVAIVVLSLASYGWAVRSGFHTGQLDHALNGATEDVAAASPAQDGSVPTPERQR